MENQNGLLIGIQLIRDGITKTKLKILEQCYPNPRNIKQISEELKIRYWAVYKHLIDLEKKGYIKVSPPKKDKMGKPREVRLTEHIQFVIQELNSLSQKSLNT